jgi:hypothetical protein
MKIQEMIFMIIAIAIFFIMILLFYLSVTLGNLKKSQEVGVRSGTILLLSAIAGSPELNCPWTQTNCVDADKVMALIKRKEYSVFWPVAGLKIEKVYPYTSQSIECNTGNYPNCNSFSVIISKSANVIRDSSYISLCRRELEAGYSYVRCDLAKIIMESEKKQ